MGDVVTLIRHDVRRDAEALATTAPQLMLGAQARLLSLMGSDEPLAVLLDALARYVETWAPGMLCSVLLADAERGVLVGGAAPSLPQPYVAATSEVTIAEGSGCCGTSAFRKLPVYAMDLLSSPLWTAWRPAVEAAQLRACWSEPFMDSDNEVLGTLAMYFRETREPSAGERTMIAFAASLARVVVQRHRDLERLRQSEENFRCLGETCPEPLIVHSRGTVLYANPAFVHLLELSSAAAAVNHPLSSFVDVSSQVDVLGLTQGRRIARLRTAKGRAISVEVIAAPGLTVEHASTVLVCRDVAEQLSLERSAIDAADRERERISIELHDNISQKLAGSKFMLASAKVQAPASDALLQLQAVLEEVARDTEELAGWLRPVGLRRDGLKGALEDLAHHVAHEHALRFDVYIGPFAIAAMSGDSGEHLYRMVQSAAIFAAEAGDVAAIDLKLQLQGPHVQLKLAIDGTAFTRLDAAPDFKALRYRARRIGATLSLEAPPASGSLLRIALPAVERVG